MKTRAFVLASAAVLLTGCFDGHYDLGLKNDGSGRLAVEIVLDKDLSRDILKENKGKLSPELDHSSLGKNARKSQRIENGAIVIAETLDFRSLPEVSGGNVDIEVKALGRTILGAARSQDRFAATAHPAGGPKNDRSDFGRQLVDQVFKGHTFTLTMRLPCVVEGASTVVADGVSYSPKIDKGWFRGSTVAWSMPMSAAFGSEGTARDFTATCWSYAGITPGRSRAR
jgi:hypothetical protein